MSALLGWHPGEESMQRRLDTADVMRLAYTAIEAGMPPQHQLFHSTRLHFLPVTTLDAEGRPWGSILAAANGKPGFIHKIDAFALQLRCTVWPGDPLLENIAAHPRPLIAGIGIELSTRRRNKLAGQIVKFDVDSRTTNIEMEVNQAIGNCPKYINVRDMIPHPQTCPIIVFDEPHMSKEARLPPDVVDFILRQDTVFFGTTYIAEASVASKFPSHVGMNHRGGRPGFIRVSSDGKRIILPDYSGNRLMTSLGNVEATPLASLTFIDFLTGDILYITGSAHTLVGLPAQEIMPRVNVITVIEAEGFVFVRGALPVRQRSGTEVERSPYSPPVWLLAEENPNAANTQGDISITLQRVDLHAHDLATFSFAASQDLPRIHAGQAAIVDMTSFVGKNAYRHMAPGDEAGLNDDGIRTWTISQFIAPRTLAITVRAKPGGKITPRLLAIANKMARDMPELLEDASPLRVTLSLVGISGDFVLPAGEVKAGKLLWIAGGIGITPFLAMLRSMKDSPGKWDIRLILSTREPATLSRLINSAYSPSSGINLVIDLFTTSEEQAEFSEAILCRLHQGRATSSFFTSLDDVRERTVFLCGPLSFEEAVLNALRQAGVDGTSVHRENFAY